MLLYDSVKYENFVDTKRQEIGLVNIIIIRFLSLSLKMLERAGNLEV